MNLTASLQRHQVKRAVVWNKVQEKIKQLREKLKFVKQQSPATTGGTYCLIVPIVNPPDQVIHFFVGCFDFSMHARNFFTNASFYDSLERNSRRILRGSTAAKWAGAQGEHLLNNFILHKAVHRHLQQSDGAIRRTVLNESCPEQLN
jgi:hypothetical protein